MSIEREELHEAARKSFANATGQNDPSRIWQQLLEMGWMGISVPERLGGLGLDDEAEAVVHFELGRILGPAMVTAHMSSLRALAAGEQSELLSQGLIGKRFTTSLMFDAAEEEGGLISGELAAVPDADSADYFLIAAGERIVVLPAGLVQLKVSPTRLWDTTRNLSCVTLDRVPLTDGLIIASGSAAYELWDSVNGHIMRALAADSLGGTQAVLEMTVDYLKVREQFGRPLATFQALKHRCADLHTALCEAEALFWRDMVMARDETGVNGFGSAKAAISDVYADVAEEAIQLHGGIGLTQEHGCHLFLKRAFLNAALGGSADVWNEAYGRLLLASHD